MTSAGVIGGTTAIGDLVINATSASHTGAGVINIDDIGDDTVAASAGTVNVGNANTTDLNLTGDIYRIGAAKFTATSGSNIDLTDGEGNVEFDLANASLEFAGSSIELTTATNLVADTGNAALTVLGIRGTSGAYDDVTLSTTGTLTVGTGGIGSGTEIGDVSLDGGTLIALKGNITTAGTGAGANQVGDIDFDGPVSIDGAVVLTSDVAGGTTNDGKIDFSSTIVGDNSGGAGDGSDTLTIETGAGTMTITGTIGEAASSHLDGLFINDTAGTGYTAALSIPQIGTHGTRAGVQGITTIGNANTTSVTLSAAGYQVT